MEAQISGLSVVVMWHAGIPEVVLDGHTGLLVEERGEQAMAEAMQVMLPDVALTTQLGKAGKVRAKQLFKIEKYLNDITRLSRVYLDVNKKLVFEVCLVNIRSLPEVITNAFKQFSVSCLQISYEAKQYCLESDMSL